MGGFLVFLLFSWVYVACGVALHFASSAFTVPFWQVLVGFCGFLLNLCGFCGFGFSHPLRYQFLSGRWLFGFAAFGGFSAFGSASPLIFGLGFPHPQHRQFLSGLSAFVCAV